MEPLTNKILTIVAFGAHPDPFDMPYQAGGTLAKYAKRGHRVVTEGPEELEGTAAAAAHYLKGLVARNEGDNKVALNEMLDAASLDPREPRIRERLVEFYVRNGELESAVDQALSLRELEPENARLKRLYADLSLDHALLKEALRKKF